MWNWSLVIFIRGGRNIWDLNQDHRKDAVRTVFNSFLSSYAREKPTDTISLILSRTYYGDSKHKPLASIQRREVFSQKRSQNLRAFTASTLYCSCEHIPHMHWFLSTSQSSILLKVTLCWFAPTFWSSLKANRVLSDFFLSQVVSHSESTPCSAYSCKMCKFCSWCPWISLFSLYLILVEFKTNKTSVLFIHWCDQQMNAARLWNDQDNYGFILALHCVEHICKHQLAKSSPLPQLACQMLCLLACFLTPNFKANKDKAYKSIQEDDEGTMYWLGE